MTCIVEVRRQLVGIGSPTIWSLGMVTKAFIHCLTFPGNCSTLICYQSDDRSGLDLSYLDFRMELAVIFLHWGNDNISSTRHKTQYTTADLRLFSSPYATILYVGTSSRQEGMFLDLMKSDEAHLLTLQYYSTFIGK